MSRLWYALVCRLWYALVCRLWYALDCPPRLPFGLRRIR